MASFTKITKKKRARRRKNMGHERKMKQGRRSTVSYEELFADCGEPGKPAPAPKSDK
ncbi:MAG: hypothetical protein H6713_22395 [Myxococcales bacterium]|nr:hypothetical protein [Myxococcales bacterium]MCB9752714.1 hypothetical protein [Myxococcales bacterium]